MTGSLLSLSTWYGVVWHGRHSMIHSSHPSLLFLGEALGAAVQKRVLVPEGGNLHLENRTKLLVKWKSGSSGWALLSGSPPWQLSNKVEPVSLIGYVAGVSKELTAHTLL